MLQAYNFWVVQKMYKYTLKYNNFNSMCRDNIRIKRSNKTSLRVSVNKRCSKICSFSYNREKKFEKNFDKPCKAPM